MVKFYHGSCLCGSIKIILSGKPSKVYVCYCSDCRKNSGNLGQINAAYNVGDLQILDADSVLAEYTVVATGSGKPKHKSFCGKCGCTIRTICESVPGETYVRVMLLDDGDGEFIPEEALFEDEKVRFTAGVESKYF